MLTDESGLGMALAAIQLVTRHQRRADAIQHTFGLYRLEILAAFVNALCCSSALPSTCSSRPLAA